MEVHEGLSLPCVDEIDLAVGATALMATAQRNAEALPAQSDGVARKRLDTPDVHRAVGIAARHSPVGIIEHQVTPLEIVTHQLIHHHPVALVVLMTK